MNKNKLVDAYIDFMGHLYEAMDNTLHSFADALEISKTKTNKDNSLTPLELTQVSDSIERDVKHAAQSLSENSNSDSLSEWLKFDIQLLENFALDAFLSVADKTRIELERINELAQVHRYTSGDITVAGTFICDDCGKEIAFKTPSQIPQCPACGGTHFVRI
jgi:rubrerythrin